jgi:hypothetical protein
MVQPIGDKPLLPAALARPYEVREILEGQSEVAAMPARPDIKESRFRQSARCLGLYKKGQLIAYSWFRPGIYEEDEVRCTYELAPADQSVFDFDLFIFPEHRMGLAFVALWNGVNSFLREQGVRYTFSRLTRFNLPSRRAHGHLGWKRVAGALFLQVGAIEVMVGTLFPYVCATLRSSDRIKLRLTPDVLR